jgi:ribosomal protein S6--L-glutamate ligase
MVNDVIINCQRKNASCVNISNFALLLWIEFMILSFHPCIDADINSIVAGRPPGPEEESMIKQADAIILPQGVRKDLYALCRKYTTQVFPNYDIRFQIPGKIGDISLFRSAAVSYPKTFLFHNVADYHSQFLPGEDRFPFSFPFVIKGNYGGEGRMIYKIDSGLELQNILNQFEAMESSGTRGFIVQQWIDHGGRDVRVVVLLDRLISYWRVQKDPQQFLTNLSAGGTIDPHSHHHLLEKAENIVHHFCKKTGINLAGIDLMYNKDDEAKEPLFLEINYWFGRRFFGSSEAYYAELKKAVKRWLATFDPEWPEHIR